MSPPADAPNPTPPGELPTPNAMNELHPSNSEVNDTLFGIERASNSTEGLVKPDPSSIGGLPLTDADPPRTFSNIPAIWLAVVVACALLLGRGATRRREKIRISLPSFNLSGMKQILGAGTSPIAKIPSRQAINARMQASAEHLLQRVASGDLAATAQVLAQSDEWTGQTQRTPAVQQWITAVLNRPSSDGRQAAIQATLALDGIPRTEAGFAQVQQAVEDPNRRVWALWMLGALGNRGIEPDHAAKQIAGYLGGPDANVRAGAVDGLALVATDETVPLLLDRFRNDASPMVQEHAARALAEAGMYTHPQRMSAAGSLVGWVNDSRLTPQQHQWTLQALRDISGQNLGNDSTAWQNWYEHAGKK